MAMSALSAHAGPAVSHVQRPYCAESCLTDEPGIGALSQKGCCDTNSLFHATVDYQDCPTLDVQKSHKL